MEVFYPKLKFRNNSDQSVQILINLTYPDSSLTHARVDKYLDPHSETYVGDFYRLDQTAGLTVFVFDEGYFDSKWHEHHGTPDTYLEEDHILKKFYHSKKELDNLVWRLIYP